MNTVTAEEAKEIIKSGSAVLVDFSASWCGPCQRLAPILEELEQEVSDVQFVKIDIDNDMDYAQETGVSSVPTVVLFKDGEELQRVNGLLPKNTLSQFVRSL